MDVLAAIQTRRSVRKFKQDPVSEDDIETMLAAAMAAPSAGNSQPWRFIVIDNKNILEQVSTHHPYASMAADAPLGILICGDEGVTKNKGFWVQGCAAAMENLLLAAHALGYGGLWCGVHPLKERELTFRQLCKVPNHIIPFALALLGRPDHPLAMVDRYNPYKIFRNEWDAGSNSGDQHGY